MYVGANVIQNNWAESFLYYKLLRIKYINK
jgi:hypothetical protein